MTEHPQEPPEPQACDYCGTLPAVCRTTKSGTPLWLCKRHDADRRRTADAAARLKRKREKNAAFLKQWQGRQG